MQSDRKFWPRKDVFPLENQVGVDHDAAAASRFDRVLPPGARLSKPTHGVEFQPPEIFPKNFIIFDQTEDRSQIIFHPAISNPLNYPGFGIHGTAVGDNLEGKFEDNEEGDESSEFKEDLNEIDALLSIENNEDDESDGEEVSTARTNAYDGCSSPESYSNYGSKSKEIKHPSSSHETSVGAGSNGANKRKQIHNMVNALRGILPGGDQMNTVDVLDEAVKYLKSLKVEAEKLGVADLQKFA